ncbi:MAG: hypothetical protein EOO27_43450 [Comamonadaceae bacterium]|nr:MAG: hypothetical protein EOO27_43450 [Comamonadaceae bacterium]
MPTLKLGLHKLPAAEVVLIQTLLRLYGGKGSGARWTLTPAPPWDAVLVDDASPGAAHATWEGLASAVLRITRIGGATQPDAIERPIRPDRLLRWLDAQRPAVQGVVPAAAQQQEQEAASAFDSFSNVRYRLRRWPPSSVLRNDARRVRMATLLSKRAFSASELAAVSQQPPAECHAMLRLLRGTGLVEEEIVVPPSQPALLRAETTPVHKPARRLASGLIGGLRRRLGI